MSKVLHFELEAKNPEKLSEFYSKTFNWKFEKWKMEGAPDYWLIEAGAKKEMGINGGMARKGEGKPVNTIGSADLEKDLKKIKSNGGKIISEKMPIMGMGWLAYFEDPEGNVFGLMQPDKKAR